MPNPAFKMPNHTHLIRARFTTGSHRILRWHHVQRHLVKQMVNQPFRQVHFTALHLMHATYGVLISL